MFKKGGAQTHAKPRHKLKSISNKKSTSAPCHANVYRLGPIKRKELSQDLRNHIVAKHTDGIDYSKISKLSEKRYGKSCPRTAFGELEIELAATIVSKETISNSLNRLYARAHHAKLHC